MANAQRPQSVRDALRSMRPVFAAAFLAVTSCVSDPAVDLPEGAVAFTPPEAYAQWWSATESCSQVAGSMAGIKWYVVPGVSSFATDQGEKVGIRIRTGDDVSIVVAGDYQMHEMVVRHEMLHALLREPGHPQEYFTTRCKLTWESWSADHPEATATAELS